MSWAALNFLWMVPVAGTVFVAAVLLNAVWHSHRSAHRRDDLQHGYGGSKPSHVGND
jgi:hypothetical protein